MSDTLIVEGPRGVIVGDGRRWEHDGSDAGRQRAIQAAQDYVEHKREALLSSLGREPTARELDTPLDSDLRMSDAMQRGRQAAQRLQEPKRGPLDWIDDRAEEIRQDYLLNEAQKRERLQQLAEHKAAKVKQLAEQEHRAAIEANPDTRIIRKFAEAATLLSKGDEELSEMAAELAGIASEGAPAKDLFHQRFDVFKAKMKERDEQRTYAASQKIAAAKSEFDAEYRRMTDAQAALTTVNSSAPDVTG
jgi:hypothetical protein